MSEELTDSCYIVKDLPPGASYVFRVGCISRTGAGPFSDTSAPFVTATQTGGTEDSTGRRHHDIFLNIYSFFATDSHMSLIHTESLRSKGTGSEEQPPHKSYNFLSEINRSEKRIVGHDDSSQLFGKPQLELMSFLVVISSGLLKKASKKKQYFKKSPKIFSAFGSRSYFLPDSGQNSE